MPVTRPTLPRVLQVNNSGAWKSVCHFDDAVADQGGCVREAAESMQFVDERARFRIATDDGKQTAIAWLENLLWRLNDGINRRA